MKATIVNTVENTTKVVELTNAITDLAGLKHFLNIDEGQFFEGTTHTDLTSDTQELPVLPDNKKERGYVFFVSPAQSKIKNGAYSRKECYAIIKDNNLGEAVKNKFGRNFTQVSTNDLNDFIASHTTEHVNNVAPANAAPVNNENNVVTEDNDVTEKELMQRFASVIVTALSQTGKNSNEELLTITNELKNKIEKVFHNPYSVQDIANMQK